MESSIRSNFNFIPTRFAWAVIHPTPTGTVYFIGGAFFGSFPTIFYRFLLKGIFEQGYTVVALPFRFSFRHWSVALELAENQKYIRQILAEEAKKQGFEIASYTSAPSNSTQEIKEYWLGHSLGCKYIALLELLTDFEVGRQQTALCQCLEPEQIRRLEQFIDKSNLASISLYNQPSILLDPVIADLDNAIPLKSLQKLFSRFIKILPSRKETFCLIEKSNLFSLTSIISFNSQLAQDSVINLKRILQPRLLDFKVLSVPASWFGKHLAALGINSGKQLIVDTVSDELRKSKARPQVLKNKTVTTPIAH